MWLADEASRNRHPCCCLCQLIYLGPEGTSREHVISVYNQVPNIWTVDGVGGGGEGEAL